MSTTPAEIAGETVTTVVENALAAAETSIADANARADAAREAAALVTEAAIERAISDRVDDCEEGIEQCQNDVEGLQNHLRTLQQTLTELQTSLSQQVTMEILTAEIAKLSAQPLIQPPSNNQPPMNQPANPEGAVAPEVPEHQPKTKRYHLT
jgi:chromosome segregation ATPase